MKKLSFILLTISGVAFADDTGLYVGGGLGYGMQNLSIGGSATTSSSPSVRGIVGYQLGNFIGAEAGYTYITQAGSWNSLGSPSTTVYDLAFTPGLPIPLTPVTVYARLGVDAQSTNLNNSWYNQMFSNMTANFEYGAGVKVNIPMTRIFVRAEYINFGGSQNNNNNNLHVTPSLVTINAAYVF